MQMLRQVEDGHDDVSAARRRAMFIGESLVREAMAAIRRHVTSRIVEDGDRAQRRYVRSRRQKVARCAMALPLAQTFAAHACRCVCYVPLRHRAVTVRHGYTVFKMFGG